ADAVPAAVPQRLTRRGIPRDANLRVLAGATLVNTAGNGAMMTTFALYFTHVVGLAATQVGLALSVAALCGMLAQVPMGHLGDVRGPREVLSWLTAACGVTALGLLVTHNLLVLCVVLGVQAVFDRGAGAVRNGFIARIAEGGRGVEFKAYLRAVTNVGISLGALLGGLALAIDQTWAYLGVFALDALTFVVTSVAVRRLPHLEPAPARAEGAPRLQVLRDVPFVVVSLLTGIFAIHFLVMELAIPLWIAGHTSAPNSLVAVVLLVNTVSVALLQVRLSRGATSVPTSARALAFAGAWILGGFTLFAFAGGRAVWVSVLLVLAGAGVHVVGEMVGSGGQWGLQMGLAPRERQGQYQGFAGMSFSLANIVGPPLIALLCIDWGTPGWIVLGTLILGAGVLSVPVSAWALRTRERYGVLSYTG
ncbi:MAG TPA: MFS transporter, partial [Angustibacter sp.]|nr:MFS transporter [Angustibacter sp.]